MNNNAFIDKEFLSFTQCCAPPLHYHVLCKRLLADAMPDVASVLVVVRADFGVVVFGVYCVIGAVVVL